MGLEPTTFSLTGSRTTIVLPGNIKYRVRVELTESGFADRTATATYGTYSSRNRNRTYIFWVRVRRDTFTLFGYTRATGFEPILRESKSRVLTICTTPYYKVEREGIEPPTRRASTCRSTNLSYLSKRKTTCPYQTSGLNKTILLLLRRINPHDLIKTS